MTLKSALVLSAQNSSAPGEKVCYWCWGCTFRSCFPSAGSWVGAALGTQLPLLRVRVSASRCRWIPRVAHAQAHAQEAQNCRAISVSWWKSSAVEDQTNGLISTDISKLLQSKTTATWEKGKEWEWGTNTRVVPLGTTGVQPGPRRNFLSGREMSCELWSKVLMSQSPITANILWPLLFSRRW